MTYAEKLKTGQWQERRLEIMKRDDFRCQLCKEKDFLHVHHIKYLTGKDPWESPDDDLVTYCESCHTCVELAVKIEKRMGKNYLDRPIIATLKCYLSKDQLMGIAAIRSNGTLIFFYGDNREFEIAFGLQPDELGQLYKLHNSLTFEK